MPPATAQKNIGVESSRALVVALAVLAIAAGAALMLIGANLGILYALIAVFAVFAVIMVVVAPVLGIVVFVGTLLLGLPWFLAGDGRLTANNLLGLILFAVLILQVCRARHLWLGRTPRVFLSAITGADLVGSLMRAGLGSIPAVPPPKDQTENT